MAGKKDLRNIDEAVVVIWMPLLRTLPEEDHKCPCFPKEHGFCPCSDFIENLECKCGLFLVKESYRYEKKNPDVVERVKVHV